MLNAQGIAEGDRKALEREDRKFEEEHKTQFKQEWRTQEQLDGGRRTFWNEGIANGKVIPKGWVHQECISFNLGLYEKSYQV